MSEKIILTYFNVRGKAELIRFVLIASNVEFEDKRIEFEEWPQLKPSVPTGQLPIVKLSCGSIINESMAIARYFAKKYHLTGSNEIEEYKVDRVVCTLDDLFNRVIDVFHEKDEAKKETLKHELNETHLPAFLDRLDYYLKDKNGDFFLGDHPSLADLQLVNVLDHFEESQYQSHPKLVHCYQKVLEHYPKLKHYKDNRHESII